MLLHRTGTGISFQTEFLTMYRPNFCADCGVRITRKRWHLWTSRRFCADCARRFRQRQILLPLVTGAALFGIGLAAGRAVRPAPPLIIERGQLSTAPAAAIKADLLPMGKKLAAGGAESPTSEPGYGPDGTATERPTDPHEVVSMCGARTKKGTPCTRRVRGTGRCWQHRGLPAMLPASKLIIQS